MDIKNIISCLVKGKKNIYNAEVKVSNRKFQLAGVGTKAIKVRPNKIKGFPNLEMQGFLDWSKYDQFSEQEKALVQAFIDELP